MDINHSMTLDDSHPGFTFQGACSNSDPLWSNNLSYTLLSNGCIATVGATTIAFYLMGKNQSKGTGGYKGMAYEYADRLITNEWECAISIYDLKTQMNPHYWWHNMAAFNLYGCPALGLFTMRDPTPQGRYSMSARVYVDYRCDGFFQRAIDKPLDDIPVSIGFPDDTYDIKSTGKQGFSYFHGFDVPAQGMMVRVHLPDQYRGNRLELCPNSRDVVQVDPDDFSLHFRRVEFRARHVAADRHSIRIKSAVINGRDISRTRSINVDPGAPISGTLEVMVHNPDRPEAVVPVAATPNWKWGTYTSNSQILTELDSWADPGGSHYIYTLPEGLTAPTAPGTYYIGVFSGSVYTSSQLLSCDGLPVDWDTRHPLPLDAALDVADWNQEFWQQALRGGHVDGFRFCHQGVCGGGHYGAAAIKVQVGPMVPEGFYSLTARVYIDQGCDTFFQAGVDVPLQDVYLWLVFPGDAAMWRNTGPTGHAYFHGFDVPPEGVTLMVFHPWWYPDPMELCPNSPSEEGLLPEDFHLRNRFIQFRYRRVY
jgi:hypothetical protein